MVQESSGRPGKVEQVKEWYGAIARSGVSSDDPGARRIARAFGYSPEDLAALPAQANMGLSCGNPLAAASLRPGEVVLDLGAGGGLDVLLASRKVGPGGKAIGIDMTPEMLERARANAVRFGGGKPPPNVEFYHARMEALPVESGSVDCLISNCVINLAADKAAVFREMFRVLRPGGRVAVSDIALKRPLPPEVGEDLLAFVGCVAGALPMEEYRRLLQEAGFQEVAVVDTGKDLNVYAEGSDSGCCGSSSSCTPEFAQGGGKSASTLKDLLARHDLNSFAASVQVYALKPGPR